MKLCALRGWRRPAVVGLTGLILTAGLTVSLAQVGAFASSDLVGVDYRLIRELGHRWLQAGSMYADWQFSPYRYDQASGTNDVTNMPALYPPLAGPVFALAGVLPAVMWWAIPLGILAYTTVRWRPRLAAWPLLAAVLLAPTTGGVLAAGGTTMWITGGIAAGLELGWPSLIVALKPSFLPFAFVGADRRSWSVVAAGLVVASLLMFPEWVRYAEVLRNASGLSAWYSIGDTPLIAFPVVAWIARPDPAPGTPREES